MCSKKIKSFHCFIIQITWHPVSREVGNVKNKNESLPYKVDVDSQPNMKLSKSEKKSRDLMAQWLSKGKDHSVEKDNQNEDSEKKRVKKE